MSHCEFDVNDLMGVVIADLGLALELDRSGSAEHDTRVDAFHRAMEGVVRVECGARISEQEIAPLADLRHEIADLVRANSRTMTYYLMNSHYRATSVIIDGWRNSSIRRSAIQFLLEDYPGVHDFLEEDGADLIDEIDTVLRDHADEVAPIPKHVIPEEIPESHWWWWEPSASPAYAEHARQILE
ncbi:hypothetical protein [Nocardia sp. XZ_19_231]|uniref:hypothetical protein n=1 Tax=Nocardia sp. XZ_19_231 TaxID=2769252 RepID=UPI00188F8B0E|nr:hypothetical protein [Nocardia sp. XZ_19_231]